MKIFGLPFFFLSLSETCFGAGLNAYAAVGHSLGLDHGQTSIVASLFVTLLVVLFGLSFRANLAKDDGIAPSGKFSLRFLFEGLLEFIYGIGKENCGHHYRNHLPLLCGIFIFVLVSNLSGLVPGFPPATETIELNLAMGLMVFFSYNYAGLKEHGIGYLKHFLGPVLFIAPLMFLIEIASHASRPLSLAIRLMANIFGDHLLLGVFTDLTYFVVPTLLMFLGLLVAVIQAFLFTLLTSIYISLAIAHDH